ncbi:MAG: glycosyltransferase family 87 protein [bacterium]
MDSKLKSSNKWAVIMIAVMGIIFIWLAAYVSRKAAREQVSDFQAYYMAAKALCEHADPYVFSEKPYIYPPLFATLCMPLATLPIGTAAVLYLPFLIAAVLFSLLLGAREFMERFNVQRSDILVCSVMFLTLLVMEDRIKSDLQMFQVNSLLLFLMTLSLRWLDRRPFMAGAALGLALNIKMFPVIVFPYLLFRRRWTTAAAMAGSAAAFGLLPALVIGWKTNLQYLAQSSGGFLYLLGIHTDLQQKAQIKDVTASYSVSIPSGMARVLGADHSLMAWLIVAAAFSGLILFGALVYRHAGLPRLRWPDCQRQKNQPWRAIVALEWAALITVALVFSPQTNSRHFLMLTTLATLAATLLIKTYRTPAWRPILTGTLLLLAGLTLPPGSHRQDTMHTLEKGWQFIGGPSWMILLSLIPLLWGGTILIKELPASPRTLP